MGQGRGIIVQKFGGSSVATPERIRKVARRVVGYRKRGFAVVVVVSAMGDMTDELITLADQITRRPREREMDMLLSTGEQVSISLLAMAIHELGCEAISFTGGQVGIITDAKHTKARVQAVRSSRIAGELRGGKIVIVAGFQGVTADGGDITTLGRGGSDTTAVVLAKSLSARACEIYTDVDGVFTADPRIVPLAHKLAEISYEEMHELASTGAQVMHTRAIEVAGKFDVPLHVRSSFHAKEGTMICKEAKTMEEVLVRGVALNKNEAKLTVCDVPDRPGLAAKIFRPLADHEINVDMIIQNTRKTGKTDISFTVATADLTKALDVARASAKRIGAGQVITDENIAKVSAVGIGMRSHSGVAADMFDALAARKINIHMISTSEIKISCVVEKKRGEEALRILHRTFGLDKKR